MQPIKGLEGPTFQKYEAGIYGYSSLYEPGLELGGSELGFLPTDLRYKELKDGNEDPDLAAKLFQYGPLIC